MKTLSLFFLSLTLVSCITPNPPIIQPHEECSWIYSFTDKEWKRECSYVFTNNNGDTLEIDIAGELSDKETSFINASALAYQTQFSLSKYSSMKMAKVIFDYKSLRERSDQDIADFAQKLYGVNPSEIVSAVSNAQVGNNSELDLLIAKASKNLGTTDSQTRAIIQELHNQTLIENGIEL